LLSRKTYKLLNISIHDVCPSNIENIFQLKELLVNNGFDSITFLLVPFYHGKESLLDIKSEIQTLTKNSETILHGYTHLSKDFKKYDYRKMFTYKEAEFLLENDLSSRLDKGIEILKDLGIVPKGFIAPAWLFKKELLQLLKEKGFLFTTDRRYIYNLESGKKIFSPVLTFGSRGFIEQISILSFDKMFFVVKNLNVIRIAIHPVDIKKPSKIHKLLKVLDYMRKEHFHISSLYHIIKAKNLIKN
jgi:predicted deacetylase